MELAMRIACMMQSKQLSPFHLAVQDASKVQCLAPELIKHTLREHPNVRAPVYSHLSKDEQDTLPICVWNKRGQVSLNCLLNKLKTHTTVVVVMCAEIVKPNDDPVEMELKYLGAAVLAGSAPATAVAPAANDPDASYVNVPPAGTPLSVFLFTRGTLLNGQILTSAHGTAGSLRSIVHKEVRSGLQKSIRNAFSALEISIWRICESCLHANCKRQNSQMPNAPINFGGRLARIRPRSTWPPTKNST